MKNKGCIKHDVLDSDYDSQMSYVDNENESLEYLSNSSKQSHLQNSSRKESIQQIVQNFNVHNAQKYSHNQQNFEIVETKKNNSDFIHNHSNFDVPRDDSSNDKKVTVNRNIQSQMKKHKKDFLISEQIQVNRLPRTVYTIKRKIFSIFGGKKINFILSNNDNIIIDHTFDLKQKSSQFKTNQIYFIDYSDEMNIFSMRQSDSMGNKYITIKYSIDKTPIKHKLCQIIFYTSIPGISNQLLNMPPKVNSKGKAFLHFGERKVIPSSKNMIFVDQNGIHKSEIIAIMKKSKSIISIEAISTIPEEMIFMLGVSSFLNHSS